LILTLVAVLATDILAGVAMGLIAKMILSRWLGGQRTTMRGLLSPSHQATQTRDGCFHFRIDGPAGFSNFLRLKADLHALPQGEQVIIDVAAVPLIDHTVMDFIERFRETHIRAGGEFKIDGLDSCRPAPNIRWPPASRKFKGNDPFHRKGSTRIAIGNRLR
jgi:MFS superfamily sulfate permease-like transporter